MFSVVVFILSFSLFILLAMFGLYASKIAARKTLEEKVALNCHDFAKYDLLKTSEN